MTGLEIAAIVGAASSIAGQGANAYQAGRLNKKNRKFQQDMYNQQRNHQVEAWNNMNMYNSPIAQMGRLKEAGLNPMMIYGQGAGGAGSASSPATPATFQNYEDKPADFKFSGIGEYVAFRQQAAQTDNVKANTKLAAANEDKVRAETANTNMDTINKSNLSELQKRDLTLPAVETANAQLEKIKSETSAIPARIAIDQQNANTGSRNADINADNARTSAKQADIAQYNARTNRMSAQSNIDRNIMLNNLSRAEIQRVNEVTNTQKYETLIKKVNYDVSRMGGNPNDPGWQKAIWYYAAKVLDIPVNSQPNEKEQKMIDLIHDAQSKGTKQESDKSIEQMQSDYYKSKYKK